MRDFTERYGSWALVAGAADGIGAAFSESLAQRGMNLVMADKNASLMAELAGKLEKQFGIRAVQLRQDLSEIDAWKNCMDAILPYDCRLLLYIPAYSPVLPFLKNNEADLDLFINLNCRTPLHLVHAFAGKIKNDTSGGILLLSSLAGLVGPPFSAVYAGTKAFNILLAEALNSELREHRIDVTVCCAGMTDTSTFRSGKPKLGKGDSGVMHPSKVAEYALKNLGKKSICIPGWKNRLSYFFLLHLLPRKIASRIVAKAMHKIYPGRLIDS